MQEAQTTFISSTNWTDRVGPTAALATLGKYQCESTEKQLIATDNRLKDTWQKATQANRLQIDLSCLPSLVSFGFKARHSKGMKTQFTIEMLHEGFLGFKQFKTSLAHGVSDIDCYELVLKNIFKSMAEDPECIKLSTPKHHNGFSRIIKERLS
jgi:glutamate-1-semialdehyde 2,1-aminomutase